MREAELGVEMGSAIADERAILRVLYSYCHAIDYGEEARWLGIVHRRRHLPRGHAARAAADTLCGTERARSLHPRPSPRSCRSA